MKFATEQEARDFLDQNPDIDAFELFILDANGVPRGKLLHRDELLAVYQSGRPLPSTILGLTLNGDDVENSGLVWDVGDIDCRAYPLAGSLVRMPWRRMPTAAVQVSMHPSEGMPAAIADPRHVLIEVIERLKADGFHPVMACELEFYLLDQKPDAQGRPQPALDGDGRRPRTTQVYGLRELEQIEPFLADLYAACKAGHSRPHRHFRIRARPGGDHPGTRRRAGGHGPGRALQAPGQGRGQCPWHAGLFHGQALRSPGRHRHAHACQPGRHRGPQPVRQRRPGRHPAAAPGRGRHARLAARFAAAVLPQRQLLPPLPGQQLRGADLGVDNRTVSLRVPGGPAYTRHIEHRICGADANPYLAAAAILAAIHRGIRDEIDPGEPIEGNGYAQAKELLPTDWLTALQALENSGWAREALGAEFLGVYLAVKRAEYRQFMAEVGEQDWRWYLNQA